jgi:hypothetical protein
MVGNTKNNCEFLPQLNHNLLLGIQLDMMPMHFLLRLLAQTKPWLQTMQMLRAANQY